MSRIWFLGALGAILAAAGCVPGPQYDEMRHKYEETHYQLRNQVKENSRLESELARLRNELTKGHISQQALEQMLAAYKRGMGLQFGPSKLWTQLPGGGIRLGALTFQSGSAKLSARGLAALEAFAAELRKKGNVLLVVDGHTDNDPIVKTKHIHASNWELSGKRAAAVLDYLVGKGAANPKKSLLRGWGEQHPIASNDTRANKARNRRVEVFAIPLGKVGQPAGGGGTVPAATLK